MADGAQVPKIRYRNPSLNILRRVLRWSVVAVWKFAAHEAALARYDRLRATQGVAHEARK